MYAAYRAKGKVEDGGLDAEQWRNGAEEDEIVRPAWKAALVMARRP